MTQLFHQLVEHIIFIILSSHELNIFETTVLKQVDAINSKQGSERWLLLKCNCEYTTYSTEECPMDIPPKVF